MQRFLTHSQKRKNFTKIMSLVDEPLTEKSLNDIMTFVDFCNKKLKELRKITKECKGIDKKLINQIYSFINHLNDLRECALIVLAAITNKFLQHFNGCFLAAT